MKPTFLLIYLFAVSFQLSAIEKRDSLYLKSIQTKATYWEDRNIDSSNYFAKLQVTEAGRLQSGHFKSTAYNQLGCNANRAGKVDSALYFFTIAEAIAKPFGIEGAYPSIIYNRAQVYRVTNQLDKSIADLKQVLRCDLERRAFKLVTGTLNELGNCMIANDQILEGMKYYMLAYRSAAFNKDSLMLGGLSINMASEFLNLKLKLEAKQMALNSLHWFTLVQNPRGISFASNLLAQLEENNSDNSYNLRKKALIYALQSNDISHLASVCEGLGSHFYTQNQYDSSLYYHKKAIFNRKLVGQAKLMSSSYFNIASVLYEKGEFKAASGYLDSLYSLPKLGNIELLYLGRRLHARVDSSLGNFKSAHAHLLAALEFNERYFNDETKTELLRAQANLESQKKDLILKNAYLNKEISLNSVIYKQKKQQTYLGFFVLAMIILFSGIFYHRNRRHRERELKLKLQLFKSEMDGLDSQINTHFIYNTLAVIQRFIYQNMPEMAMTCLGRFTSLLRISLIHSRNGYATLASEMEALKLYADLESYNHDDIPLFTIEISPDIAMDSVKIPPMLIQPLLENAFKHGISNQPKHGKVWIHVYKDGDKFLKVGVRDNGPQFSSKVVKPGLSISSGIIADRLQLLNQKHRTNQFTLKLKSELYKDQKTTLAEIILPLAA